jgi:RecB family endonuclease NucS
MGTDVYTAPDPETVAETVAESVRSGATIVVFAECEVDYDGRAAGYVGPGDRVIIGKPDGTLLVHRPSGNDPVNWQPPGSTITTTVDDEGCTITARRSSPDERVQVHLRDTYQVTRFAADDTAPLELTGTETDMHEYILDHPEEIDTGLRAIEHERDTPYGTIDVFGTDAEGRPVIIEVKRRQATLTHVDQLKRYMEQYRESNPDARGILVAPAASDRVKRTLQEADLEFVALDSFATNRGDIASTTFEDFV